MLRTSQYYILNSVHYSLPTMQIFFGIAYLHIKNKILKLIYLALGHSLVVEMVSSNSRKDGLFSD